MRVVPLAFSAIVLLPLPAMAQSLGSPAATRAPAPRTASWGGGVTQPPGGYKPERLHDAKVDFTPAREIGKIRHEIRVARDEGQITRRQARALFRETRRIGGFGYRASAGGVSASESAALRSRIEGLRGQLVAARTQGLAR